MLRTPKKVFHEYFHYACYLKANGEATKSGKMEKIFLQLTRIHYLQGDVLLENIFCLLVSQEKIYVEDPKKGIS
jgi:hypothetical protein